MTEKKSIRLPSFGKIVELERLDSFIWSTLHGWGAIPASKVVRQSLAELRSSHDPKEAADRLARNLKAEERDLELTSFTSTEAADDYPYLFSLVTVRLWAFVESSTREFVAECVKNLAELPKPDALMKVAAPVVPFIGADIGVQSELAAKAYVESIGGQFRGAGRYEEALNRLGFPGALHGGVHEMLTELCETRHCVVHRNNRVDRKMLEHCPWLGLSDGAALPATLARYWFYRNAVYLLVLSHAARWAEFKEVPQLVREFKRIEFEALGELLPAWEAAKRLTNV